MRTLGFHSVVLATAIGLAGCGGGGGGVASIPPPPVTPPTPPPPPPPPPPPTPTPVLAPVIVLPSVTSSTQFATLGYEGTFFGTKAAPLIGSGFSVSYDAAAHAYVMDVPSSQPGAFESGDPAQSDVWTGKLTDPSSPGQFQAGTFGAGRSGLDYTAWTFYQRGDGTAGWLAFGVPTPQSAVPITGSATYTADALGYGGAYIAGRATLQFNFGAGNLSGTFDAWDAEYDPGVFSYGHFMFANTVVGSGSTLGQFSGELSGTGTQHGSFNGLLTGPNAQELLARWTANYPNSDNIMYGIWVGKKN